MQQVSMKIYAGSCVLVYLLFYNQGIIRAVLSSMGSTKINTLLENVLSTYICDRT